MDLLRFFRADRQPAAAAAEQNDLYIYRSAGPKRIVVVTLFEVARDKHDEIITKVGKTFAGYDKIVYVTDLPEFLHFRAAGAAFEYFPSLTEQTRHRDTLSWHAYLSARWEIILAKWQPEHVLAYGANIDRFLAATEERPA
ncbi:hypothetical protein [Sinorhizobium sp. RAC02]|uniref:hypothetical protein n=1 Tax=Sinorhizobium sp. RAC02 TaxID=1842534 RepID=UPI00083D4D1B|nr:hypothetical protein [Sinorhizobium sp. RAC02]AOF90700.1 hypothetical protein BSY16_3334 [Sinorhizobium sp. RAC02]